MNSVIFIRQSGGELKKKFQANCNDDFYDLIEYTLEDNRWSYLIDPRVSRHDTMYACGNFYCTRLEGSDLLITDIHQLDINDYDDVKPVVVNQNTAYGLAFALNVMIYNKEDEFTITQEGQRYTVTSPNTHPFVFDPDLGVIYNDMIPIIIVRVLNDSLEYTLQTNYHTNALRDTPTYEDLEIFGRVFIRNLSRLQATIRYKELQDLIQKNNDAIMVCNDIKISIDFGYFRMEPIKQDHPNFISVNLSPYSVLKFLQAWESRLQFCDSFTLVFLGKTLRFFEGEPL